jgi:hypothetical protein
MEGRVLVLEIIGGRKDSFAARYRIVRMQEGPTGTIRKAYGVSGP